MKAIAENIKKEKEISNLNNIISSKNKKIEEEISLNDQTKRYVTYAFCYGAMVTLALLYKLFLSK
jgi:hypothetical protein